MSDQPPIPNPAEPPPRRPDGPDDSRGPYDDTAPMPPASGSEPGGTGQAPAGSHPTSPPPPPPPGYGQGPDYASAPEPAREQPRRTRFAAGLLVGALVLGAAAGLGGAALWDALDDDDASSASGSSSATSDDSDDSEDSDSNGSTSAVEEVASKVLPSVVKIEVAGSQGQGSGSGIVLTEDGQILTNNHVVEVAGGDSGRIAVSFNDGTRASAEVVGTDSLTDLAVIQAQDVSGLTAATTGNSMDLTVGETVVAVGSPYGLDATVTSGIVSALNRPVDVGQDSSGNTTAYPAIQTDAAINPGNSGGPLVDLAGNVVGINSSILSTSSSGSGQATEAGSIGLGFAIPINAALPIVEEIVDGKTPTHARLGITVSDPPNNDTVEGALIRQVGRQTAAAEAGLESGDVITRIDDHAITGADSLIATIRSYRPGDTVKVTYERDGEDRTTELELGSDAETD